MDTKMSRKTGRKSSAILFLLFACSCIAPAIAQQKFAVSYLGIEHGLSNNAVTCIYQDHYGFLWFGTYDGLNRYDGSTFRVFRNQPEDSTSLVNNRIVAIAGDRNNGLWIGTKHGISRLNHLTSTFSCVYYLPWNKTTAEKIDAPVNDIKTDDLGNVLIGTAGKGLLLFNNDATRAIQVPFFRDGKERPNYYVQSINFDSQHRTWLFIQGEGICLFDENTLTVKPVNRQIRTGTRLLPDNQGNLWLASENGLFRYNIAADQYTSYTSRLTNSMAVELSLDKKQNLWIATDGGGINILHIPTDTMTYVEQGQNKTSLTSGAVYAIYEDKDARVWIGTLRGGINVIDPQKNKFRNVTHDPLAKNTLLNDFILSFCEDENGNLWIGTDGEGLSYWNRQANRYTNFVHNPKTPGSLSSNNIARIVRDHQNTIWVATYGGGICRYNKETKTFKRYPCFNTNYQYEDRNVWSLYKDSSGDIWAGTCTGGGLYRLNRKNDRFELFDVNLTNVITLAEDRKGNLWAGTFTDLVKVDTVNREHEIYPMHYPVRGIRDDGTGILWIGTEGGGMVSFNATAHTLTRFTEEDGLPSNSVLNILQDDAGYLWLSTYNGLSRFDPATKRIKNFYQSDGLSGNQFNYNAATCLHSGEFVFGGIKGLSIFYPDSITTSAGFPELVFTGIRINNVSIEKDTAYADKKSAYCVNELTMPYDKAVLSVDFAALEYTAPDKITYAYYLDGWDNDWNYSGGIKTANYSRLTEGEYTLRIKSTNADGLWNEKERILHINVLPPWYRTWWMYTFYGLMAILVFVFYALYQRNQAKLKYEIKLAHIQTEKEKELNERKLEFFTNISHEFRSPLTLIINPAKELLYGNNNPVNTADVGIIYRNAKRLLSLVDQLLLFRKADTDDPLKIVKLNFISLCKEVFLCFVHQAKSRNIRYELECNTDSVELFADRDKIEIALFNVVSNALKYTPDGGTVIFKVSESDINVEVSVIDSGCGIPEEPGTRIFDKFYQVYGKKRMPKGGFGIGLYLAKKFIESHQGKIDYSSKVGEGTTFTIALPKGKNHLSDAFIFEDVEESSVFLEELVEDNPVPIQTKTETTPTDRRLEEVVSDKRSMLIIDDNDQIRQYIRQLFTESFDTYESDNAEDGIKLAKEYLPDIVICDVLMKGKSGIEFCSHIKEDSSLNHIPVILLTASSSPEIKLKGIEGGADDYITKPFEKELLIARVSSLLRSRNNLQKYFYNEVTLQSNNLNISEEYKTFLTKCIDTIETHLEDTDFNIKTFAAEMGMSHSNLYKKIKSISGQSAKEFIRFIRLRKAAELMINTNMNINEVAFKVGFNDIKYFREQFIKLFDMKPSEYIRKYRNALQKNYRLSEKAVKPQ